MNTSQVIQLQHIEKNPHRDLEKHPVTAEQVAGILDSYHRNGVWPNVVVRPHPTKPGFYQLAHGHHRYKALTLYALDLGVDPLTYESSFIVDSKLSDWDMLQSMVDENETQQTYTPRIVSENINAACDLIEHYMRECETVAEFNRKTGRHDGNDGNQEEQYQRAREAFLAGDGIGRRFLGQVLSGRHSNNPSNIQAVLDARYAESRADVADAHAAAAAAQAAADRQKARLEKDEAKAALLRLKAEEAQKEYLEFKRQAEKIRSSGVPDTVLMMFPSVYQMSAFVTACKKHRVPPERQRELAAELIGKDFGARQFESKVGIWWYTASGAAARDAEKAHREQFRIRNSKELDEFCIDLAAQLRQVSKRLAAVRGHEDAINQTAAAQRLLTSLVSLDAELGQLKVGLQRRIDGDNGEGERVISPIRKAITSD